MVEQRTWLRGLCVNRRIYLHLGLQACLATRVLFCKHVTPVLSHGQRKQSVGYRQRTILWRHRFPRDLRRGRLNRLRIRMETVPILVEHRNRLWRYFTPFNATNKPVLENFQQFQQFIWYGSLNAGPHYPYVRAVRTARTYGPYGKKHCMQCFFARTYGWCVRDARLCRP